MKNPAVTCEAPDCRGQSRRKVSSKEVIMSSVCQQGCRRNWPCKEWSIVRNGILCRNVYNIESSSRKRFNTIFIIEIDRWHTLFLLWMQLQYKWVQGTMELAWTFYLERHMLQIFQVRVQGAWGTKCLPVPERPMHPLRQWNIQVTLCFSECSLRSLENMEAWQDKWS